MLTELPNICLKIVVLTINNVEYFVITYNIITFADVKIKSN